MGSHATPKRGKDQKRGLIQTKSPRRTHGIKNRGGKSKGMVPGNSSISRKKKEEPRRNRAQLGKAYHKKGEKTPFTDMNAMKNRGEKKSCRLRLLESDSGTEKWTSDEMFGGEWRGGRGLPGRDCLKLRKISCGAQGIGEERKEKKMLKRPFKKAENKKRNF